MTISNTEFDALLNDSSKRIADDIVWEEDEDHSPCWEFRAEVQSTSGWPLFVRGTYNPLIPALSYVLILKTAGRIYGLDLGKEHHNPQCQQVGDKHKHRWSEQFRDKEAYVPDDITATAEDPVEVWTEFCAQTKIEHCGRMPPPPGRTGDLFL